MAWVYVPEWEGSSLDSSSSSPNTEVSVYVNGTLTQRPLRWPGWERRPWIRLLSGTMLKPSTADLGVASWIASLEATRANPSASPANALAKLTRAISGPTSTGLLSRYYRHFAFSRTSQLTLFSDSPQFRPTWKEQVTELRRDFSVRRKWAQATAAPACSFWPTTTGKDSLGSRRSTARTEEWTSNPGTTLTDAVQLWPTPLAEDCEAAGSKARGEAYLSQASIQWPTPKTRDVKGSGSGTGEARARTDGSRIAPNLDEVAEHWPSPKTSDVNGVRKLDGEWRPGLNDVAAHCFPQDPSSSTDGPKSSKRIRRLNPLFVEWLMGWPRGWTAFEPVGMEWSRWLLQQRLYLFGPNYSEETEAR